MPALPQMPLSPNASLTKLDGSSYGENDPEFWELANRPFEKNGVMVSGGIREHRHFAYPKMLFKAINERGERDSFERQTVESEIHHKDFVARMPGFCETKAEATAYLTAQRDEEARSAANAAYKADRMTEPARREYRKRSADSPDHAQE